MRSRTWAIGRSLLVVTLGCGGGESGDTSCAQLAPGDCASDPRCLPIEGTHYDVALECRDDAPTPLGCRAKEAACADYARTTVKDERGQTWLVYGGSGNPECQPRGYTAAPGLGAPSVEDWQSCAGLLAPPCAQLSPAQCSPDRCAALTALPVDLTGMCVGESVAVGCMSRGQPCTAALTLASDPSGGLWHFTSGCLPTGWAGTSIPLDGMSYSSLPSAWKRACPPPGPPCEELSPEACPTSRCWIQTAVRYDLTGMCQATTHERVGCSSATVCNDAGTLARDPSGNIWGVPNSCVPRGWTTSPTFPDGKVYQSVPPPGWQQPCP